MEDIKGQLAYREENREKAAQFCTTRSFGEDRKVLLDEDHRWFTVTRARDLAEANPDILDFDAITGCRMDIDESRTELTREDADGKGVPTTFSWSSLSATPTLTRCVSRSTAVLCTMSRRNCRSALR